MKNDMAPTECIKCFGWLDFQLELENLGLKMQTLIGK